jgi:hypothetical protein
MCHSVWVQVQSRVLCVMHCVMQIFSSRVIRGCVSPPNKTDGISLFDVYWSVHRCDSQWNEEPTRCYLVLFITLLICSTYFAHLYVHHQELATIYHCSPRWTSASWVLMVVRCGLAGYVAGLATTARSRRSMWWTVVYNRELLMMGIEVPETCWAIHKCNKNTK